MSSPHLRPETLEITVVGGNNLKDDNLLLRMFPYIVLSYAGNQFRTRSFTNGGKNPRFNKKHKFVVVEGFLEVAVTVWNKNLLSPDSLIGTGKIDITKVLKDGFDDYTCKIQGTGSATDVGDVKFIMNFSNPEGYRRANAQVTPHDGSASPYVPVAGFPPPSPYHQYAFHAPPPMQYASASTIPPPLATPSAPYPPSEGPLPSYNNPSSLHMHQHPATKHQDYDSPRTK